MNQILIIICVAVVLLCVCYYYMDRESRNQHSEPLFKGCWHMLDDQLEHFGVNAFLMSIEKGFIYIEDSNDRIVLDREFRTTGIEDGYILCDCFCERFKTEYIEDRCHLYD